MGLLDIFYMGKETAEAIMTILKSHKKTIDSSVKSIGITGTKVTITKNDGSTETKDTQDTVYNHPNDTNTRHVTDTNITTWNAKENAIKDATAKTTLVDADTIPLTDSADSSKTKKITFANIKAVLKNTFVQKSGDTITDLTVDNVLKAKWIQQKSWMRVHLGRVVTNANVANQKANIVIGKTDDMCVFEVEITGGFASNNSIGRLTKQFGASFASTGDRAGYSSRYTHADSAISANFAIGEMTWNATIGWYIPIGKRTTADGNTYSVVFRSFGYSETALSKTYLDTVYTTDASTFTAPRVQLPTNAALYDGSANKQILSDGNITNSAEVATAGMVAGAALTNNLQAQIMLLNNDLATLIESVNASLAKRVYGFRVHGSRVASPGYYRVASMQMTASDYAIFSAGESWIMSLDTIFGNTNNMSVTLLFNMAYTKYQVTKLGGAINTKQITKVRVSRNASHKVFIDIYYAYNVSNDINISINNITGRTIDGFVPESFQAVTDTDLITLIEYDIV